MSRLTALIAAGALAASATAATAADWPGTRPVPVPIEQRPVVEKLYSGWYLRGDLGYRWGMLNGAESMAPFASPTQDHLGTAINGTIGAGIKSNWLRTDLTLDYASPQKYRGTIVTPDDTTAKIQTGSLLLNGYLDLGGWWGFTPYIGAGAGASRVRVSDYISAAAPPFATPNERNQWNFTWAAMAGVGWLVAPNLMLDFGYRYLNFGDVKTASDAFGEMKFRNVAAQEVRVGLRWSFDDYRVVR